jgi:hypothetical protein
VCVGVAKHADKHPITSHLPPSPPLPLTTNQRGSSPSCTPSSRLSHSLPPLLASRVALCILPPQRLGGERGAGEGWRA